MLEAYDHHLLERDPRQIFVVCGTDPSDPEELGLTFCRAFPEADVTVFVTVRTLRPPSLKRPPRLEVVPARTLTRVQSAFARRPAPDLIVDHGSYADSLKHGLFSHLFLQLVDGGLYLLGDRGVPSDPAHHDREGQTLPELIAALRAIDTASTRPRDLPSPDDLERARALAAYEEFGSVAAIRKQGTHYLKVREEDASELLTARQGPGWGRELVVQSPARSFRSRATLWSNRPEQDDPLLRECAVPAMTLRVHHDVVCLPRQLVLSGDVALPASFHHPRQKRLRNRGSLDISRYFLRPPAPLGEVPTLPGTYYHLDSEFPGHFGHVITEDLARLWGWDQAKTTYPDLRLLVGVPAGAEVPAFQLELLAGFGIGRDEVCTFIEPVQVEHLVTATTQLHNGQYVDPAIEATWDRIAAELAEPSFALPTRVFVTRPPGQSRTCLNGPELERVFVEAGFAVVSPETMTVAEQVTLFAGAEVVAGYGGSGQLTAAFSPRGIAKIVVSSESYYATNEWLISSVKGDDYYQLWCPSSRPQRSVGFDGRSFHADFRFDFDRDGAALEHVLTQVR